VVSDLDHVNINSLVVDCTHALETPREAPARIEALLRKLAADPTGVMSALPGGGTDETHLYESPELTIVRVEIAPAMQYPPHDHTMPAIIALLAGEETNTLFRNRQGRLEEINSEVLTTGSVSHLEPHVIHAVSNRGRVRSVGIHIYLGALFNASRSIWDITNNTRLPYTDDIYLRLAYRRPATLRHDDPARGERCQGSTS
jgi:predicted metal-dependent enzyme (double-stranded beta helix superfamily)